MKARIAHLRCTRGAALIEPDVQVVAVDMSGDRCLHLRHTVHDGVHMSEKGRKGVIAHLRRLWGYDVELIGADRETGKKHYEVSTVKPAAA